MASTLDKLLCQLDIADSAELFENAKLRSDFLSVVKKQQSYATYFKDKELRELLFDLIPHMESIPREVRELLAQSPNSSAPKSQFIEQWNADLDWPNASSLKIDPTLFLQFIADGGEVMERFSQNNLHNSKYFYSKLMEWYVSYLDIVNCERKRVVDIGAAYFGFGRIAERVPSVEQIMLVDLGYPAGPRQLTPKTTQIGSNASHIDCIEDRSIDLVTLHNAIEHFTSGADAECFGEISRILKPGGKAIISPLFFEAKYAISLNPVSAFFFLEDKELQSHVLNMRESQDAVVRLCKTMLSPYAHIYDYPSLKATILKYQSDLQPMLRKIEIIPSEQLDSGQAEVFGVPFERNIFESSPFYTLELTKPES